MTLLVTSEFELNRVTAPNLPLPPQEYSALYINQLNNVLRLYFNRLDNLVGQLKTSASGSGIDLPFGAFHQDGATFLTASMSNVSTAPIQVVSTTGLLNAGTVLIENELVGYTSKTSTTLIGITRGIYGTTNLSHAISSPVSEAQGVTSPTTYAAMQLTVTDYTNGVYITGISNKVYFTTAGYYNLQFSAQLLNFTTADDNVNFWFKQSGVDIPYSSGLTSVPSKHGSIPGAIIVGWNNIIFVNAGEYIELLYSSDNGNTVVATYPAGLAPVHPVSPALALTATFVSAAP